MIPIFYPIVDTAICSSRHMLPLEVAAACLRGGARLLQLRCKDVPSGALLEMADHLVALARPFGASIVINDRADITVMSGAAGVHVGQDDLPVPDARSVVGSDRIVGVSTHDRAQVDAAVRDSPTYIAVGPIFETATKETGYSARGLDLVRYAAGHKVPVVAIGGITLENAAEVLAAGAHSVAVIGDLLTTGDPEQRTRAFLAIR